METVHFHDLNAEGLQPGQQPVQRGLVPEGSVQHGFDRLHRGGEPLEVKQNLGRYDPDYADLVVGRWHHSPQPVGTSNAQVPTVVPCDPPRPTHGG